MGQSAGTTVRCCAVFASTTSSPPTTWSKSPNRTTMRSILPIWLAFLAFASFAAAQYDYDVFTSLAGSSPTPTTMSPEEEASKASISADFAALITGEIQPGGARSGDAASAGDDDGSLAGASGGSNDSINISKGGIIAIAVVVSCVVVFGSKFTVL